MNQTKRSDLLALLNLVRPALASQSFVPAWTHILLIDGYATAYNDTTLISVKVPLDKETEVCVPGELFIKTLNSFNGESVLLQEIGDGAQMLVSSGKSKVKVPTLDAADFKLPKSMGSKPWTVDLTDDMLKGITSCRFAVGTDPTHPAQMGVTLGEVNSKAVLYSTDNITISRYATIDEIELAADTPVILPTFFCDQVLALAKAYPTEDLYLDIYAGALTVRLGKSATVMTKTLVDLEPLDFEHILDAYLKVGDVGKSAGFATIPATMDSAFARALLVLSSETDKSTKVTLESGGEEITLLSKSAMGESTDTIEWGGKAKCRPFYVDPALVTRAAKSCGSVAFYDRVLLMASDDAKFLHLIAHCNG